MAIITQVVEGELEITQIPNTTVQQVRYAVSEELDLTMGGVDEYLSEEGINVAEDGDHNNCALKDFVESLPF